jgi:epoxyqueuosine reductase
MITKERIKILAEEVGFDACGITSPKPSREAEEAFRKWTEAGKHGEMKYLEDYQARHDQFWAHFENAKSIIVLGINYYSTPNAVPQELTGRVARYAWGTDYHKVIPKKLEILKQKIREEAGIPVQLESATDTRPLFERSFAQRAGLGFFGKQTQLLSLNFGPWLFLSELVTDLELEPDQPFSGNCGTCRICIDECPTNAIEETGSIDARKCIAYLTIEHKSEIPVELRPKMGNWVFGCDECLNVCPYTAKQKETRWPELTAEAGFGAQLDLARLFEIKSNRDYEQVFGESAISRAKRKQLLRNACVVLGNLGSEEALPILEQAAKDRAPLVHEHAQWAIDQIRKRVEIKLS